MHFSGRMLKTKAMKEMQKVKCNCGHYEIYGEGTIHSVVSHNEQKLFDLCEKCWSVCSTVDCYGSMGTHKFISKNQQYNLIKN